MSGNLKKRIEHLQEQIRNREPVYSDVDLSEEELLEGLVRIVAEGGEDLEKLRAMGYGRCSGQLEASLIRDGADHNAETQRQQITGNLTLKEEVAEAYRRWIG